MILIDGVPFSARGSDDMCFALMEHPVLLSASHALKAKQETNFSDFGSQTSTQTQSRWVYIFQREYATVDPALVDYVGTDEATTCVGVIIRNRKNGMTSIAHMDSPKIVDRGFAQMLLAVADPTLCVDLDVHLVGGFEDALPQPANGTTGSESHGDVDGYSFPLCSKIIAALHERNERFHIQTLLILGHNTTRDSQGNACPIFNGFMVELSTGSLIPARFDRTTRCPDEIVRRIRVIGSYEDPIWDGKLLETYDTRTDQFVIAACAWTNYRVQVASMLLHCSDTEILRVCSTSPSAEGPDFVANTRREWNYLIEHPDWRYTFPGRKPRIFQRTPEGGWRRLLQSSRNTTQERVPHHSFYK